MQVEKRASLLEQAQSQLDRSMPELPPIGAYSDIPRRAASVTLLCASEVKERPIRWLWPGWLARGKLTILAGAAGTGKTTLALGLASAVTTAARWPDGVACTTRENILVWSSEDDPADTLKPRLMACGADVSRVFFVQAVTDEYGNAMPFDPARDIPTLHDAVKRIGGAAMLMVDPIVSAISGDMHKANDVRRGLQSLVDFAEEHDCAVLGISHFSKGSAGSSPQDRVIGSQAFGALARTVLVAAKQEGDEARVLARAKSNISLDDGGVSYYIEPCSVDGGIETTRVTWGETIDGSAREILGSVEASDDESTERADAEQFLRDLLSDGPVPAKTVKAESSDAGYAWATIRRAQKAIGVEAYREGAAGTRGGGAWLWRMPIKALNETLRCSRSKGEHLNEKVSTLMENPKSYADLRG
ncbi:AAA family ATPase [Bordetella genomosp. 9]|nr:AAA family ATPase [Bordetella genomosp. 9]